MTPRAHKPHVSAPVIPDSHHVPPVEHRAPVDEQPFALAAAEEAGTLPAVDRRADIAVGVPSGAALIRDGGFEAIPQPAEEVIASPVVRDLSQAHERVMNDRGGFDYFTASGEQL